VRGLVVLTFDVGPQAAVEGLEALEVLGPQARDELEACGSEPPFLFTLGPSCRMHPMRMLRIDASASRTRSILWSGATSTF
jgi:hypothetical protein